MLSFSMLISKDKGLTIGIFGRNYRIFGFLPLNPTYVYTSIFIIKLTLNIGPTSR